MSVLVNSAVSTGNASVETTLELPQGTWIVRGDYTHHESTVGGAILQIDGVTVHTASSHGDTQGTSQSVLFGFREITATSAKTITIKGIQGSGQYAGSGLIMATATRSASADPVPGTGDLCKILSEDSGYQMFRNGLTMQWVSSPAFITESSQVVDFPIPFASKPFKVVASTRYPSDDGSSQQWIQVVTWNATSVTVRAQSQNVGAWTKPVYADIIAIGIAEVTDCPGSTDPNDPSDPEGTKISQLTSATQLKDDDLFVISKENTGDGIYDISQKVTLEDLSTFVTSTIPEPSSVQPSRADYHLIQTSYPFYIGGFSICYPTNHIAGPGLINGGVTPAEQVSYLDILLKLGYIEEAGTISVGPCFQTGFGEKWGVEDRPAYRITSLGRVPGAPVIPNPLDPAGIDPRTNASPDITVLKGGALDDSIGRLYQVGDVGWAPSLSKGDFTGGVISFVPRAPKDSEIMLYLSLL